MDTILYNRKKAENEIKAGKKIVKGWYVEFKKDGKYWKPYLGVYEGAKAGQPTHFTELSDGEFLSAKLEEGRRLEAYERCQFASISKIKYNRIIKAREEEKQALAKEMADLYAEREAGRLAKIEAKKQNEINRLKNAEMLAKTDFSHLSKNEVLAKWKESGFIHPCPNEVIAIKNESGLSWNKFRSLI